MNKTLFLALLGVAAGTGAALMLMPRSTRNSITSDARMGARLRHRPAAASGTSAPPQSGYAFGGQAQTCEKKPPRLTRGLTIYDLVEFN